MSHSVTITRTTTTSNTTSAIIINTGYLKTIPGILKLVQLILGAVVVGILAWYYDYYHHIRSTWEIFYLLMSTSFLIGTFCLLLACLFSLSTGGIISKTLYEFIYHAIACIMYTIASVWFLIKVDRYKGYANHDPFVVAGGIGIVVSILYLISAVYARKAYRGI